MSEDGKTLPKGGEIPISTMMKQRTDESLMVSRPLDGMSGEISKVPALSVPEMS